MSGYGSTGGGPSQPLDQSSSSPSFHENPTSEKTPLMKSHEEEAAFVPSSSSSSSSSSIPPGPGAPPPYSPPSSNLLLDEPPPYSFEPGPVPDSSMGNQKATAAQEVAPVTAHKVEQGFSVTDMMLWLLQVGSLVAVIVGVVLPENIALYAGAGVLGFFSLIVLFRACCSPEARYLQNILSHEGTAAYVHKFRSVPPKIEMHIECYHWETRYRTVTSTDSKGNTTTRTESYQEKVVTYRETQDFFYDISGDFSGELKGIEGSDIVKMRLYTSIIFDEYTKTCFDTEELFFVQRNRFRDVHYDYWRKFYIPGLQERSISLADPNRKPIFLGYGWFLLSHLVLMQYFYLIYLRSISTKMVFTYKKSVVRHPRF